jgi:conjugal transfer/type IV secretion protein DotA/TraY
MATKISTGKLLKYTLLPGFLPRLHAFFTTGFVHIAYTIALIYQAVRLLPPNHPYLDPANFGRYGIRHVISEAANNLVLSRKNLDQIIIFFTILGGMALLLLQIALLITAVIAQPALAGWVAPTPMNYSIFNILDVNSPYGHGSTGGPGQDIAFIILDRVFGLSGTSMTGDRIIFASCVSDPGVPCRDLNGNLLPDPGAAYPFPMHIALHTLLQFYSLGIFFVAAIVIIYFVTTIVGETAVTGSPFGQRFNKTWGPVRLILFFALLVPLNVGGANGGLNGAQLITFWTAKLGSNFATNAWGRFNDVLTGTYLGQANELVATPNTPEINALVRFMFVAKTCKVAEEYAYGDTLHAPTGVQAYVVRDALTGATGGTAGPDWRDLGPTNFQQALDFSNKGNIEIRFGVYKPTEYPLEKGNVKAICGTLTVPITALDTPAPGQSGAFGMQEVYYDMVKAMWNDAQLVQNATCIRDRIMQTNHDPNCATWPETNFANNAIQTWTNYLSSRVPAQIANQVANGDFAVSPGLRATGWAGAAIWYNRIAQLNGEISTAIANVPYGDKYPYVMEKIALQNKMKNENLNPEDIYDPALGGGQEADYPRYKDRMISAVLYNAYMFWANTGATATKQTETSGQAFTDTINLIFGTQGVYSMRENTTIHPLAQLSALGKSMMDASVRNIAVGLAGSGLSQLVKNFIGNDVSGMGKAAGDFIFTMGKATMVMSFILYYVLPFLPFIYFMFAVSGWVKSIFEAVVAMPLWALAHITRMDGQGIAGPGANNGYFLLLEIFLRPILILTGLLASITIFSAMVRVLNEVFDLVVSNVSGFDMEAENAGVGPTKLAYYRQPIDKFFFSILYVIMVYMMATGFFKMIDQVPNNILRWMGVSVSTFSEAAGDPASELTGKVYQGGTLALGQVKGGGQLAALLGGGK